MGQRQQCKQRERSRGVAALELALSLIFLVPLVLGTLDFGYYFYVGAAAEDAARVGVREAVRIAAGSNCAVAAVAQVRAKGYTPAATSGLGCAGGAAYCYMNEPPLSMGGPGSPKTTDVVLDCLPSAGLTPTMWRITVTVDFVPVHGLFKALMPASPVSGRVRYTARLTSN